MKKVAKEVIDFATFLTIYRGAWISKDNSGARVAALCGEMRSFNQNVNIRLISHAVHRIRYQMKECVDIFSFMPIITYSLFIYPESHSGI